MNPPIETKTVRNYSNLPSEVDAFARYKSECEKAGNSICLAHIEYDILKDDSYPVIQQDITEIDKPFCFPKSCEEQQLKLMDPLLKTCVLAGDDCHVIIKNVECPQNRTQVENSQNCANEQPSMFSQISILQKTIYGSMDAICTASTVNSNEHCSITGKEPYFTTNFDYSMYDQADLYRDFSQNCVQEGGLKCETSYELVAYQPGLTLTDTRMNMPICIPKECSSDVERVQIIKDIIMVEFPVGGSLATEQIPPSILTSFLPSDGTSICSLSPETCNLELTHISCDNSPPYIEPTNSPSQLKGNIENDTNTIDYVNQSSGSGNSFGMSSILVILAISIHLCQ